MIENKPRPRRRHDGRHRPTGTRDLRPVRDRQADRGATAASRRRNAPGTGEELQHGSGDDFEPPDMTNSVA